MSHVRQVPLVTFPLSFDVVPHLKHVDNRGCWCCGGGERGRGGGERGRGVDGGRGRGDGDGGVDGGS